MSAAAGDPSPNTRSTALSAGRVGRPHGLDGSFYVTAPKPRLLAHGMTLAVNGRGAKVVRRAGTDERPLIRLEGVDDRGAAQALRGLELMVELGDAPELEEGEWWASELEGCEVVDGERRVGVVARMVELPSCEALEVQLDKPDRGEVSRAEEFGPGDSERSGPGDSEQSRLQPSGPERQGQAWPGRPRPSTSRPGILVPMVREAIRSVDPVSRRIDVDMSFLEEAL